MDFGISNGREGRSCDFFLLFFTFSAFLKCEKIEMDFGILTKLEERSYDFFVSM